MEESVNIPVDEEEVFKNICRFYNYSEIVHVTSVG